MSLLLDALNRASQEKARAAGGPASTPDSAGPASPPAAKDAATWPDLQLSPLPEASQVLLDVPVDSAQASAPASLVAPPPKKPPDHHPAVTPPVLPQTNGPSAHSAGSEPSAPVGLAESHGGAAPDRSTPAPDNARAAQDIVRAIAPPAPPDVPWRLVALGAVAVLLAAALGSVLMGLWGDPTVWFQTQSLQPTAVQPVAIAVDDQSEKLAPAANPVADLPAPASAAPQIATVTVAVAPVATAPTVAPGSARQSTRRAEATSRLAARAKTAAPKAAIPIVGAAPIVEPARVVAAGGGVAKSAGQCGAGQTSEACRVAKKSTTAATPDRQDGGTIERRSSGPSPMEAGYAALTRGRLEPAIRSYMQALAGNPEETDALLGLAYIAHQQGREDDAIAFYTRVLRQQPGNPVAQSGLLALRKVDDAQELGSRTREVAEQYPMSAAAQSMLGHRLVREDRIGEARQAFYRAHRLEPTVPIHAFNLAVALDRMRDYRAARQYYERALALSIRFGGEPVSNVPHGTVEHRIAQLRELPVADTVNSD